MKNEVRPIDANAAIEALAANFRQVSADGLDNPFYQIAEDTIAEMPTLTDHFPDHTKMVPLTLEQLRRMDGQPVWIERIGSDSPDDREWALVFCKEEFCRTSRGNIALFALYGIGWIAYSYPPDRIDREAWEPCRMCGQYEVLGFRGWRRQENMLKPPDGSGGCMYCPHCGRPRNEKAWAQLEQRLRGEQVDEQERDQ